MPISGRELSLERKRLVEVLKLLDDKLTEAGNVIFKDEEKLLEFKKYTTYWATPIINDITILFIF